jgi:type VI secretion system protein ImpM
VTAVGFFGKLPARGDFVHAGLPRSFTNPWDAWLQQVMPAGRRILGEAWEPAWLEAPVWRFALPPGGCGPDPVLGLWLPSVDRAGRYFPLTLARIGGDGSVDADFLTAAEIAGRAALAEDWPPERLSQALPLPSRAWAVKRTKVGGRGQLGVATGAEVAPAPIPPPNPLPQGAGKSRFAGASWWTDGSPRRPAGTLTLGCLPDGPTFARMLQDGGPPP